MSDKFNLSYLEVVERIVNLEIPEVDYGIAGKLTDLVIVLRYLRRLASEVSFISLLARPDAISFLDKGHFA